MQSTTVAQAKKMTKRWVQVGLKINKVNKIEAACPRSQSLCVTSAEWRLMGRAMVGVLRGLRENYTVLTIPGKSQINSVFTPADGSIPNKSCLIPPLKAFWEALKHFRERPVTCKQIPNIFHPKSIKFLSNTLVQSLLIWSDAAKQKQFSDCNGLSVNHS